MPCSRFFVFSLRFHNEFCVSSDSLGFNIRLAYFLNFRGGRFYVDLPLTFVLKSEPKPVLETLGPFWDHLGIVFGEISDSIYTFRCASVVNSAFWHSKFALSLRIRSEFCVLVLKIRTFAAVPKGNLPFRRLASTQNSHSRCGSQGKSAFPPSRWHSKFAFSLRFPREICLSAVSLALKIRIFAAVPKGICSSDVSLALKIRIFVTFYLLQAVSTLFEQQATVERILVSAERGFQLSASACPRGPPRMLRRKL